MVLWLLLLTWLVAPAVTARDGPTAAADRRPLARQALDVAHAGQRLSAWEMLTEGLLGQVARADWRDAREAAEAHVATLLLIDLTVQAQAWPETVARLSAARPWPGTTPPDVAFGLDYLLGVGLRAVGRPQEAAKLFASLGYVTDFLAIGPFDNERGGGFDVEYGPERAFDAEAALLGKERDVRWRPLPVHHPLGRVILHRMFRPSEQVLAYLVTAVHAASARPVVLRLGSTGPVKVFLNGREMLARNVQRPRFPDQDRVVLPLAEGWNHLLVKLAAEEGPWTFEARFTDLAGNPLPDLKLDPGRVGQPGAQGQAQGPPLKPGTRELLEGLADDASAQRLLALLHLITHPDDVVQRSARAAAGRAVELDPDDPTGLYLLAQANEPEGASTEERGVNPRLHALREVLQRDPAHVAALLDLAEFSREDNPIRARAEALAARAVAAAPGCWRALRLQASLREDRGRRAEADVLRQQAESTAEADLLAEAWAARADRLRRQGRVAQARQVLRTAFDRHVIDGPVFQRLVADAVDEGRPEDALERVERVLAGFPFNTSLMLEVAGKLEYASMPAEARALVERALEVCPEHTEALRDLVRMDVRAGAVAAASERLHGIVDLDPGDDLARRYLRLLAPEPNERFEDPWRQDAVELAGVPMRSSEGNDPVEALDRTTVWRIHPDGTEHRYEHLVLRALSQGGVKMLNTYTIRYPADASLQVYQLRIIHPDGTFERAPAPRRERGRGQASSRRHFDLPPLAVGDLIDVEYRIDENQPDVFGEYFGTRHLFYPESVDQLAPTRRSELVVLAPSGVPLYVSERNAQALERSSETDAQGLTVLRWVARDLDRPVIESGMPDSSEFAPLVDITTFRDWNAFAAWWWSLIEKEFVTTPAMREKVAELTDGLGTEQEKIEAINRFVAQEIRYNAWPFGTHGYEPFSAATIFERRFGDCKDKSILMRQMLAQIGVEAIPVLIRARWAQPDEPLDAAMVGLFNHCITWLPPTGDRDGTYLDATADHNPAGYLRADDQGARVLHVTAGGGTLHDVPYAPPRDNSLRRSYVVELGPGGDGTVRLVEESTGQYAVTMRYRYAGEQGDIERIVARGLSTSFTGVDVTRVQMSDLENILVPARLETEFTAHDLWTVEADRRALRMGFDDLGLDGVALETAGERTFDLVLDRPFGHHTTVTWQLPKGTRVGELPSAVHIAAPGILEYRQEVRRTASGVEVVRYFELKKRRIPLDEYRLFRDALREVQLAEARAVLVHPPPSGEGG